MPTLTKQTTLRESPSLYARVVLGIEPHRTQDAWLECQAPRKIACCGRRWGKTLAEAVSGLWFADCHDETEQFVVAPTSDQSGVITGYMETMIANGSIHIQSRVDKIIHSPFLEIQWKNSSRIHSRSAGTDGKYMRGHGADRITLDEAAYIPRLVVTDVVPPMLATSKYRWESWISTPFGHNHFEEMFLRGKGKEDGYAAFQFASELNPFVSRSYLADQKRQMTSLAYSVEYEAQFMEDQNAVFPWTLIGACTDSDIVPGAIPGHQYVIGWDPAQYADRSGVCVLDRTAKPWQVVECEDVAGRDYPVQEAKLKSLSLTYGNAKVLLDSTTHAPVLQHLALAGVQAEGYHFSNQSKRELIDGLVLAMEQGNLTYPALPDLLEEMRYYRYQTTAAGNIKLGADERHHDDLVTALALAVHAASQPLGPTANRFVASPPRAITQYQPR